MFQNDILGSRQGLSRARGLVFAVCLIGALAGPALAAPQAPGGQTVSYPTDQFDNGKARHYEYKTADGVTIRYFIMKSTDGVIRAAFDACDVCWREGKGYVQKDDFMVCRNCGRRFLSTKINVMTGGCNPGALTRSLEGGKVVIKVEHLLEGRKYFALGGGRS
ncbi:MAG: DUF2318 domain-containing protein [Deltaproteobacteria bacterium]|nr:DUF2318 domain-containing protein [Deltaproteobacteria bacterium]